MTRIIEVCIFFYFFFKGNEKLTFKLIDLEVEISGGVV